MHRVRGRFDESKKSVKLLEEEICGLRKKEMEMPESMDDKREQFVMQCLEFQRDIDKGENEVVNLLSEKEFLENEFHLLDERNNALKNFMLAFMDETVQDLLDCNSGVDYEPRFILGPFRKLYLLSLIVVEEFGLDPSCCHHAGK
ncbi:hypothetical protein DKX38_022501 [Salix brachista]|uniref:Uncharacterized protein n=1 Tax=Salix brachista TaxID=2182728 RepID=A0A5N5K0D2_9ROSI|nr:hypothetical protein DKX38_022501 [Salix brachista]